jgi:hypothetical protein
VAEIRPKGDSMSKGMQVIGCIAGWLVWLLIVTLYCLGVFR